MTYISECSGGFHQGKCRSSESSSDQDIAARSDRGKEALILKYGSNEKIEIYQDKNNRSKPSVKTPAKTGKPASPKKEKTKLSKAGKK
jgi:hypothetical protein